MILGDGLVARIRQRALETEGKVLRCRSCGKTPQGIGWCDECGYNRDYEMLQDATVH
jgi:hypothetical protein